MTSFQINVDALHPFVDDKDEGIRAAKEIGGALGLARLLKTDTINGLADSPALDAARKKHFGENTLPPPEDVTFWGLFFGALADKMMLLLMASAVVSLILGLTVPDPHTGVVDYKYGWIEGTAILVSVMIVTTVTSINDYQKEQKFKELEASGPAAMASVVRNGKKADIKEDQLLTGDLLHLTAGQIVPVDGVLVKGSGFQLDESAATGENDEITKSVEGDPVFRSGCNVLEGEGFMLVTTVGVNSFNGRITMQIREEKQDTPMQEKLSELADQIGHMGMAAAVLMFVCLSIKELYKWHFLGQPLVYKKFLDMITTSVTIVVVAVPEGLPLSVTIALAYSMKQMMHENCLVRHLAACETMGGATSICTDKTGTLTQNEMTVMSGYIGGGTSFKFTNDKTHDRTVLRTIQASSAGTGGATSLMAFIAESISVNTTAAKKKLPGATVAKYVGNKTEQSMLLFLEKLNYEPSSFRDKYDHSTLHTYPFTSAKKRMTTIARVPGALRYHVKGASEMVLLECQSYHDGRQVVPLTDAKRAQLTDVINQFARNRLRTLALAFADLPGQDRAAFPEKEGNLPPLTFLCLLGIEDPIRPEVEGAVEKCKNAGVAVRMVTGDNKATAISIARKAGIYGTVYSGLCKGESGLAMEGRDFREFAKSEARLNMILPRLQVLARASPLDKQILVTALMNRGEVVAVTGDGTNDAPALKNANVGFAMNTGTDVAKKASDVVILDDNFRSIVTAMKWGRNVNDNICKFIQFQTTVNLAAVFIAFVGAIMSGSGESPLKPVQLLWLNLIMDTMAALALATEPPSDEVLLRQPRPKEAPLITRRMWLNIIGQSLYQIALQLWLLNAGFKWFRVKENSPEHLTIIFNVFVLLQVTNEFNARMLGNKLNIFEGLSRAKMFLAIIVITVVVQYVGVTYAGPFMKTVPLTRDQWKRSFLVSIVPIPLGLVLRMIVVSEKSDSDIKHVDDDEDNDPYLLELARKREMRGRVTLRDAANRVISQLKVSGALTAKVKTQ